MTIGSSNSAPNDPMRLGTKKGCLYQRPDKGVGLRRTTRYACHGGRICHDTGTVQYFWPNEFCLTEPLNRATDDLPKSLYRWNLILVHQYM